MNIKMEVSIDFDANAMYYKISNKKKLLEQKK